MYWDGLPIVGKDNIPSINIIYAFEKDIKHNIFVFNKRYKKNSS
jgi:hypothetical protein